MNMGLEDLGKVKASTAKDKASKLEVSQTVSIQVQVQGTGNLGDRERVRTTQLANTNRDQGKWNEAEHKNSSKEFVTRMDWAVWQLSDVKQSTSPSADWHVKACSHL